MHALFFKELKDLRSMVAWLMVGIAGVVFLPRDLSEFWSVFQGFFLLPMFCGYVGSRILSGDVSDEQLPFILTLPMSRSHLWVARASAGLLVTLVASVATMIPVATFGMGRSGGTTNWGMVGGFSLCCLLVYAVAAFLALVCDRSLTAAFSAFTLAWLGAICHTLFMGRMRLWYLHAPEWSLWGYIGLWGLLMLGASWWVFTTADLMERKSRVRTALGAGLAACLVALGSFAGVICWLTAITPRPM